MVFNPAAGSFTDAREEQRETLLNRRAKNRAIFMSFAEKAAKDGRKVSNRELIDFRTSLAGGRNFTAGTIPYGAALADFKVSNDLLADEALEKRSTEKIKREEEEREIATTVASRFAGLDLQRFKDAVKKTFGDSTETMLGLLGGDWNIAYQTVRRENVAKVMSDARIKGLYSKEDVDVLFPGQPKYILDALYRQAKNNAEQRTAIRLSAAVSGVGDATSSTRLGGGGGVAVSRATVDAYLKGNDTWDIAFEQLTKNALWAAKLEDTAEYRKVVQPIILRNVKSRIASNATASVSAALKDVANIPAKTMDILSKLTPDEVDGYLETLLTAILKGNAVNEEDTPAIRAALEAKFGLATSFGDQLEAEAFRKLLISDGTLAAFLLNGTEEEIERHLEALALSDRFNPDGGVMNSKSVETWLRDAPGIKKQLDLERWKIDKAAMATRVQAYLGAEFESYNQSFEGMTKTMAGAEDDAKGINRSVVAAANHLMSFKMIGGTPFAVHRRLQESVAQHLDENPNDENGAVSFAVGVVTKEFNLKPAALALQDAIDTAMARNYGLTPDTRIGTKEGGEMYQVTVTAFKVKLKKLDETMKKTPTNKDIGVKMEKVHLLEEIDHTIAWLTAEKITHDYRIVDPENYDDMVLNLGVIRANIASLQASSDSTLTPSSLAPAEIQNLPPISAVDEAMAIRMQLAEEQALEREERIAGAPPQSVERLVEDRMAVHILERLRENKDIFNLVASEAPGSFKARIKRFITQTVIEQVGDGAERLGGIENLVHATMRAIIDSGGIGDYESPDASQRDVLPQWWKVYD